MHFQAFDIALLSKLFATIALLQATSVTSLLLDCFSERGLSLHFGIWHFEVNDAKVITDICQFCDTAALLSPLKVHQKGRTITTKKNKICRNRPQFCVLCAEKGTELKTSQELRMLSRSLSDCKSLLLYVMIQVSQFIRNGQLCH